MATAPLRLQSWWISQFILFAATSQTLIAGSEAPAEARYRLSGLKANAGTGAGVGLMGATGLPVSGSYSPMPLVWPMARSRPFGLNAIASTPSVQRIGCNSVRESPTGAWRSQSLTVLSHPAEARIRLSGEKATALTLSPWRKV